MKKTAITIKNKTSASLLLAVAGIFAILIGVTLLLNPYEVGKGGFPNWVSSVFLLSFGAFMFFMLLDSIKILIREDELEIISLFRKRIIPKADVLGYGTKFYSGKRVSGERIRIFHKKGSIKFHTTQLESIAEIKNFVEGKEIRKDAFARESIINNIILLCTILLISVLLFYPGSTSSNNNETQAIGIPAKFMDDIKIVDEEGSQIKFELKEYNGYLFVVNKNKIPENMETTAEELIIFIDNPKYAQEVSNTKFKRDHSQKPKLIPVDEISILDDVR